jgi:hypothetical protein
MITSMAYSQQSPTYKFLINKLSNEVKFPQYMFVRLVIPWLLSLRNRPIVAPEAAMYSASAVELVTVSCLELF